MKAKATLLASVSMTVIAFAPHAARAQAAQPAAGDAATDVSEIIVTAQRRSESISRVPIAVTAFSGDELKAQNVIELREVAERMSGVQIFRNPAGQPSFIIRGVGLVDTSVNNPPPASVFLDEVYESTNAQAQMPLYDVAQVEVLKGPQGGSYGRNTTGGAVKIASREPDLARSGLDATASYGSYDRVSLDAGGSIPLIRDVAALRLATTVQSGGGWQYSLSDRRDWGDSDVFGVRATLLVAPTPKLRAKLILDYENDASQLPLLRAEGVRALPAEGGTTSALYCPGFNAGSFSDSCRTYPGVLNPLGYSYLPVASPSTQAADGSTTLSNAINKNRTNTFGTTFDVRADLGPATLAAVTGYREFNYGRLFDADGTGAELGIIDYRDRFKSLSQDLRLQSNDDGPFSWALGFSYAHETLSSFRTYYFRDDPFTYAGFAAFGVVNRSQAVANVGFDQSSTTYSGYVEAGYRISPTLKINGALRYTDLDKEYSNGGFSFPLATGPVSTLPLIQSELKYSLTESYGLRNNLSGNAYLSYTPTARSLYYLSVGRGIKEGGFFGGLPNQGQSSIVPFREETVWSYEGGFKLQFFERRLGVNAAAFYYDYGNAQASVPAVSATGAVFGRPGNVDAKHKGAEFEMFVLPLKGLRLDGSVSYLDAKYDSSTSYATLDPGGLARYDDLRREFASKWSWNARASYARDLGPAGRLVFEVDANGRSNRFQPRPADANVNPALAAPTTRRELTRALPGFTLLNGKITYSLPGRPVSIALFGKNLTDERYVIYNFTDGVAPNFGTFYNDPRAFGVEVALHY